MNGNGMRSIRSYALQYVLLYAVAITSVFLAYRFYVEYPREIATVAEHQKRELESLNEGLKRDLQHLQAIVQDWAHWDHTHQFILDPEAHRDYVQTNVHSSTYEVFSLAAIAYFDARFKPVLMQGFNPYEENIVPFEQILDAPPTRVLQQGGRPGSRLALTGWMDTQLGPAIFAVDYITTSQGDAPPSGYLMFVQLVTEERLQTLEAVTRLDLGLTSVDRADPAVEGLVPLNEPALVEGLQTTRRRLISNPAGSPVAVMTIRHDPIASPGLVGRSELLMLVALILVPLAIAYIVDRALMRPLLRNAKRIEIMVENQSLETLPQQFRTREMEQIRLAFNRSVELVKAQHEDLQRLSRTDSLTGIANRRAFDELSDAAWRQAKRLNAPFVLAALDLDYFKNFNDRLGHGAGDAALRRVGETLSRFAPRSGEFCARLGGEEFAIVWVQLTPEEAAQRAEKLRAAIEALAIPHPDSAIRPVLTASIGLVYVAEPPRNSLADVQALLQMADEQLYRAKREGRNRVAVVKGWDEEAGSQGG